MFTFFPLRAFAPLREENVFCSSASRILKLNLQNIDDPFNCPGFSVGV